MIKYRIPYRDYDDTPWRVDISKDSYSGSIITLRTAQGQACSISYSQSEDLFEPIKNSTASFTVVKHDAGLIDVTELKNAQDKDWSVDVYKAGVLFWTGWLVPDGIQEYLQAMPYDIPFTATDGLKLLTTAIYNTNNWPLPATIEQRSVISHLRDILFKSDQNGKPLPIRWSGVLEQYRDGDPNRDAFTEVVYSLRGDAYTDFNGNKYSSYYIMENLLRAMQCRLYQAGGKWRIDRIPDIRNGASVDWKEISAEYDGVSVPTLTAGVESRLWNIGTDFTLLPGAYTMNLPGVKKVTTTYEAQQPENALPNGDFDNTGSSPRYWWPSDSDLDATQVGTLNKREGYAMELSFPMNSPGSDRTEYFALYDGEAGAETPLPFDSQVMFKRLSLGFTLLPQNGFPYNGDGIIQWESEKPFRFRIELANGSEIFTLNENGFWIPKPTGGDFVRTLYSVDSFVGPNVNISTRFGGNVIVGDWISYKYQTNEYKAYVPAKYSNDIGGFLNYAGQYLIDNSNGEVLSFYVTPVGGGYFDFIFEVKNHGGSIADYASNYAQSNTGRDGSIVIIPPPSMIDDIIQINFDKFQGVILPDFKDDIDYTYATLNWFFYVKQGQRYTIDDVYIKFDENNEVYEYEYDSKFTGKLEYDLKISSSKNGLYVSNIQDVYYTAPLDEPYIDNTAYIGNLTDLTARTIARYRSKSLEMFEGNVIGSSMEFGGMYTVDGIPDKKLMPIGMSINTETAQHQLTCVELNEGDTSFTRKFYGSNDKPLSNEVIN